MFIGKVHIPNQDPIGNLYGTIILIRLGLMIISIRLGLSAMTHVLVSSTKVRGNEQLWHTLDIGNIFGPIYGFKKSQ